MKDRGKVFRGAVVVAVTAVLVGALHVSSAAADESAVSIPGSTMWMDTGIIIDVGDSVDITADGTIYIAGSDPGKSPDGATGCIATADNSIPPGPFLAPGLVCWSLVGQVGASEPFQVGSSASFKATSAGELRLGVNDNFYGDNRGAWNAVVAVTSPPPPPTDADQCKKGGWKEFTNPPFKNQGDCVSYVRTGK